jgi:MoaA/NifB/PqqE/SkfB family radical SAM enzyme
MASFTVLSSLGLGEKTRSHLGESIAKPASCPGSSGSGKTTSMKPTRVVGAEKWLTEARFAASTLRVYLEERKKGTSPTLGRTTLRNEVEAQKAFMHFMTGRKYAKFDGKTFLEMYLPCSPGPIFDQMVASKFLHADRDKEVGFISTVDLAITDACMFRCEHCYASEALGKKNDLDLEQWMAIIDGFQKGGAGVFTIVGGEPLLRFDDLLLLIAHARAKSDCWLVTTGFGLTASKARQLKEAGLVAAAISLDHWDPAEHNKFRGSPKAFDEAAKAVALFGQARVFPCLVVTATRGMTANNGLMKLLELAQRLGAGFVQIFDPIATGAYIDRTDVRLSVAELEELERFMRMVNTEDQYAHLPPVTVRSSTEDSKAFGCGAGGNNFIHVDPHGNLIACPMLSMSTGNVVRDGFDNAMKAMRRIFPHATAHGPECPGNLLRDDIHEAQQRIGRHVLPLEETERIASKFKTTPKPLL